MSNVIPDYKKWIFGTLLDKYEQSQAFKTGVHTRRIMLTVSNEKKLQDRLEQIDEKNLFLTVLHQLKDQGLIDYSWVKYETGNLVDRIWLIPENIDTCYKQIGRIPMQETLDRFVTTATDYLQKFPTQSALYEFVHRVISNTKQNKRLYAPFTDDMQLNVNLLECLVQLDQSPNQMERIFSSRVFCDSKYFERTLKSRVITILREIQKHSDDLGKDGEESIEIALSEDDLLAAYGLYRWPEIYEFNGALTITWDDDTHMDTGAQIYGAYINSDAVKHVSLIDGSRIKRVIFIENKANYIDFQLKQKQKNDLVIYHGGFYSPMKGLLFSKIYEGCPEASFYHWSDIDLGGFRIFNRLRKNIIPTLQPMQMDVETMQSNIDSCMEIKTENYIQQLKSLRDNMEYEIFWDVITYMVEHRVRLEQENLIL